MFCEMNVKCFVKAKPMINCKIKINHLKETVAVIINIYFNQFIGYSFKNMIDYLDI